MKTKPSYQLQLLLDLRQQQLYNMKNIATRLVHHYNKKQAVKDLLAKYNAKYISTIAVSDYDGFLFDLKLLEENYANSLTDYNDKRT